MTTSIKEVKVTATSVELITLIGRILNEKIQLPLTSLCWTIMFDTENTAKSEALYLMSGGGSTNFESWFPAQQQRYDITVRCERSWWSTLLMWDLQIWVKHESGYVDRYRYVCDRAFAHCCRIFNPNEDPNDQMAETPPTKIALHEFATKRQRAAETAGQR